MKTLQFILVFVIGFCFFNFALGQTKPSALKFDEFDDSGENQFYFNYLGFSEYEKLSFSQRVKRFLKQLEKERGAKAYVIYYQARINNQHAQRVFVQAADSIKNQIKFNERIKVEDAVIIDGGYRENNTIELWIAPKNAYAPTPTPTFDKSETFVCPDIDIYADVPLDDTKTIDFYVRTENFNELDNYTLTWKVSGGEIFTGQGMNRIGVKINDSPVKRVTAFLEVGGLPYPCQKVSTATGEVRGKLYLFANFELVPSGELRAIMDAFLISLMDNPTAKGHIIVYGSRAQGDRDAARRISQINNHIRFRRFDATRLSVVRGGYRENVSTDLWISFDNAESPKPTPTIDEKFVKKFVQPKKPSRRKQ